MKLKRPAGADSPLAQKIKMSSFLGKVASDAGHLPRQPPLPSQPQASSSKQRAQPQPPQSPQPFTTSNTNYRHQSPAPAGSPPNFSSPQVEAARTRGGPSRSPWATADPFPNGSGNGASRYEDAPPAPQTSNEPWGQMIGLLQTMNENLSQLRENQTQLPSPEKRKKNIFFRVQAARKPRDSRLNNIQVSVALSYV